MLYRLRGSAAILSALICIAAFSAERPSAVFSENDSADALVSPKSLANSPAVSLDVWVAVLFDRLLVAPRAALKALLNIFKIF